MTQKQGLALYKSHIIMALFTFSEQALLYISGVFKREPVWPQYWELLGFVFLEAKLLGFGVSDGKNTEIYWDLGFFLNGLRLSENVWFCR